jgi:hypothetical protein
MLTCEHPRRDPQRHPTLSEDAAIPPYGHPFFVSRTEIRSVEQPDGTYSFASVRPLLEDLLSDEDLKARYDKSPGGLFAIRCVVMSPYYPLAEERGDDYIRWFAQALHEVASKVLSGFAERLYCTLV